MFYFNEGVDRNRSESVSESDSDVDGGYTRDGNIFPRNSEHRARAAYLGRETESHFFGSFEEEESEAEDQPGELVQLGLRVNGGRSPKGARPRTHSQQTPTFHDFYNMTRQHLGQGAYGCVSTCVSKTTGKEYAVKIVSKKEESHTRSRILREVNIFNLCRQHPNIVQLIEWFEDEENFYMIFEKMHGGPLLQHILEKGYFTEEEARQVTKDIATALKFLHDKGIAHRDVKPENILCTDANRVSPVKLCDLDLASRAMKNSSPTLPQINSEPDLASPVGSAEFMAPEVVDTFVGDRLKYNFKCDTWSLGVILYIMLCGYAPFQGECDDEECGWMEGQPCDECQKTLFERIQTGKYDFPEEDWSMISPEAKDLVRKLLVKDAKTRYTASDVLKHEWMSLSSRKMSSLLTADNLSKIVKSESSRDVKQIAEHFNVMNRFDGRLSANLGQMSISEEEIADPSVSRASPTKPPPSFVDNFPSHSVPLFMQPPDEFFDSLTGQVICPPSSITSPTSHIWSPMTLSTPKIHNYESTLMFQARPLASSVGLNRIASELETCQNAMARQDSKTDLHQITRETEVQV